MIIIRHIPAALRRLALIVLFLGTAAQGKAIKTWNGSVSTNWSDAGNWVPAGAPSGADDVVLEPAANQAVLNIRAEINSLTIQPGASLTLNGKKLVVNTNLQIADTDTSFKHLVMTNSADSLLINGDAVFGGQNELFFGKILIKGDLTQQFNTDAIRALSTKFIFNGTTTQTIFFNHTSLLDSYLGDVVINNPAGVIFGSNIYIQGLLELKPSAVVSQDAQYRTFFTTRLPLITAGQFNVAHTAVRGNISMMIDFILPDADNEFSIVSGYSLNLNGHLLEVGGDFTVTNTANSFKHVLMNSSADKLIVHGNCVIGGQNTLTNGEIVLYGDFTQQNNQFAVRPAGTKITFSGNSPQTVQFNHPGSGTSFFSDIEIKAGSGLVTDSDLYIKGMLENSGTLEIKQNTTVTLESTGSVNRPGALLTGAGTLATSVFGFENSGTVNPGTAAGTLTINGNFSQASQGILKFEAGGLNSATDHDLLDISDTLRLGGRIQVQLINNFAPVIGDSIRVCTFAAAQDSINSVFGGVYPGIVWEARPKINAIDLVAVIEPNQVPVAATDFVTAFEDSAANFYPLRNDFDGNGDSLTIISIDTSLTTGQIVLLPGDSVLAYSPVLDFNGTDSLFYVAGDPRGGLDTGLVVITVLAVNDPAMAGNLLTPVNADTIRNFSAVLFSWHKAEDIDGDVLRYDLNIKQAEGNLDTTIHILQDSSFIFNGDNAFKHNGAYLWNVSVFDGTVSTAGADTFTFFTPVINSIPAAATIIPDRYALHQNYPNPFNGGTTIRFDLPENQRVNLEVFNLLGQPSATLISGNRTAGSYSLVWNGRDDSGRELPSGLYFYRIQAGNFLAVYKMFILK